MNKTHNRLKALRESNGLTLRKLEEFTGITNSTLSAIENGNRRMNIRVATKLAKYFNVSIDYLVGLEKLSKQKEIKDCNFDELSHNLCETRGVNGCINCPWKILEIKVTGQKEINTLSCCIINAYEMMHKTIDIDESKTYLPDSITLDKKEN